MEKTKEKGSDNWGKLAVLGFQHLLAMFGATVLVPILTGLDISVALFAAGVGTLLFHFITKRKVPVFLGSSFAFLTAIAVIVQTQGKAYATGAIIVAGACYLVFALLVRLIGPDRVKKLFPPVVTGPVIIVIGLTLAPTMISNNIVSDVAGGLLWQRWVVAAVVIVTIVVFSIFMKGFFKLVPILFGIAVGYVTAVIINAAAPVADSPLIAFSAFDNMSILRVPAFHLPKFSGSAIAMIAPISIATFMEHLGDITTNGAVVKKNFFEDPGLHRTLVGDGIATMLAGFVGGPANTTYGENTGVLAITRNYNPASIRIAAVYAMLLSFVGVFGAFLQSIPASVIGGTSMVLFGMIAAIGVRTMTEAKVDFSKSRNLLVLSLVLVVGLGVEIAVSEAFTISGIALPALVGIVVNQLLPGKD